MFKHFPHAFLFDLDGTLLDSAHDIVFSLNVLLSRYNKKKCELQAVRPWISHGAHFMLKQFFSEDEIEQKGLLSEVLQIYEMHLCDQTKPFSGVVEFVERLVQDVVPWGVVSNKAEKFVRRCMEQQVFPLNQPHCMIGGDTYPHRKPHPYPVEEACRLLGVEAKHTIFVGDSKVDVDAGKASGCMTAVALHGYFSDEDDPFSWNADIYIDSFDELMRI